MKKIFAKYNYAFGYIKGYFVLCGLPAIVAIFAALYGMISGKIPGSQALSLLAAGTIVLFISVLIVLSTQKKCPEGARGLVGLVLSMMLAGLLASFVLAWWMFKWILKLILHVNIGGDSSGNEKYANMYIGDHNGETYHLLNACGNYAYLRDGSGNTVMVVPHGSDGLVCDNSGNIYRPD